MADTKVPTKISDLIVSATKSAKNITAHRQAMAQVAAEIMAEGK